MNNLIKEYSNDVEIDIHESISDIISCSFSSIINQQIKFETLFIYQCNDECSINIQIFKINIDNNDISIVYDNNISFFGNKNDQSFGINIDDLVNIGNYVYIINMSCKYGNIIIKNSKVSIYDNSKQLDNLDLIEVTKEELIINNDLKLPVRNNHFLKQEIQERETTDRSETLVQNEVWDGFEVWYSPDDFTVTSTPYPMFKGDSCTVHKTTGDNISYPLRIMFAFTIGNIDFANLTSAALKIEICKAVVTNGTAGPNIVITTQTPIIDNPPSGPWISLITYDDYMIDTEIQYFVTLTATGLQTIEVIDPVLVVNDIGGHVGPTSKYCIETNSHWPIYDHYWWWLTWCTYEAKVARSDVRLTFRGILVNTSSKAYTVNVQFGVAYFNEVSKAFENFTEVAETYNFTAEGNCNKPIDINIQYLTVPADYYLLYLRAKVTDDTLRDLDIVFIKESTIGFNTTQVLINTTQYGTLTVYNPGDSNGLDTTTVTSRTPYDEITFDGTTITILVIPNSECVFNGWAGLEAGDIHLIAGSTSVYSITVSNGVANLTANFVPIYYNLTIKYIFTDEGTGSTNPIGTPTVGTVHQCTPINTNTSITISPGTGCSATYTASWEGDPSPQTGSCSTSTSIDIMMNRPKYLNVTFTKNPTVYSLTMIYVFVNGGTGYTTPLAGSIAPGTKHSFPNAPGPFSQGINVYPGTDCTITCSGIPGATETYTGPNMFGKWIAGEETVTITFTKNAVNTGCIDFPKICAIAGPLPVYFVSDANNGQVLSCNISCLNPNSLVLNFSFTISACATCTCHAKVLRGTTPIEEVDFNITCSDVNQVKTITVNDTVVAGNHTYYLQLKRD